jgi:glycosyltransferase involved in cell wall biosynthesis
MPDKSILFVSNFLSQSGLNSGVSEDLAKRLQAIGWSVITTSSKLYRPIRLLDMLFTIWRERKNYGCAHIDVFSGPAFIWAEAACKLLKRIDKPFILTLRGGNLPDFASRWPGRVKRLFSSANVVTVPSGYLLHELKPYRSDIRLLFQYVDLPCYEFKLRSDLKPRLIWLRAFHQVYNPTLAPRIIAQLVSFCPDISLIMVGPDKGDGSFQATKLIVESLELTDKVKFTGGVSKEDVPHWLNCGDIFINTTHVDNTPVSILEALACGLCVVSTNVGGISYMLQHEQTGLLAEDGDIVSMVEAINQLLTDSSLAKRLSMNGRKLAETRDWSSVKSQWELIFSEFIDKDT